MSGFTRGTRKLVCLMALLCAPVIAQQNIPDAPVPKNPPPNQFPEGSPPAPKNSRPEGQQAQPAAAPTPAPQTPGSEIITTDLKQFGAIVQTVNLVQVPVTVRDDSGRLVSGLGPQDFTVYEDGVPQKLKVFISDSFPLSAAIVVETDLPASTMKKINESLPALVEAFSEFDEIALFRYGHTVQQVSGFSGASNVSVETINRIKRPGREGGPPAIFGPLAQGPSINGHPADPGVQTTSGSGIPAPVKESYVLNDAILRAAQDLSKRDRTRRRIIFVVSDGRETGSSANYDEVRRVLLSQNIAVFALGVDTAAIPIYDKLNRIRLPGFGYGNILPRYAVDSGGSTFAAFDRQAVEQAYASITDVARNQYTLGYTTRATASSTYRTIEVRVHRPNLNVTAKAGYYPLPQQPAPRH
jgi:VWFA-related protein